MSIKASILTVSLLLMIAVIILAAAGIQWTLDRPKAPPVGGLVVLGVSGAAALACLIRLWVTRKEHLR